MPVPEPDNKVEELIKKIIDVVGDWAKKFHSPDQFNKGVDHILMYKD